MHESPSRRAIHPYYFLLLIVALWFAWDPDIYGPLASRIGLNPTDVRETVINSGTMSEAPRPPCPPGTDAWAIVLKGVPQIPGVSAFSWRASQLMLALGLQYQARKPCIDPASIERGMMNEMYQKEPPALAGPPLPDELRIFATKVGARHVVVPVVTPESARERFVTYYRADADTGFSPKELARRALTSTDPALATAAVMDAAADVVRALRPQPATPSGHARVSSLTPPEPEALLERLEKDESILDRNPDDAGTWAGVGLDTAMLGYYLEQGRSPFGPRLLDRAVAMTSLARSMAGQDVEIAVAHATALLLARHTNLACSALAPALAVKDRRALQIQAACHGRTATLAEDPSAAFLYRVAVYRANEEEAMGQRVDKLVAAGLPLPFVLVKVTDGFSVGLAHQYTLGWMSYHAGDASPENSTSAVGTAAVLLKTMLGDPIRDLKARRPLTGGGRWDLPAPYGPLRAPLAPESLIPIRSDLQAFPFLAYARMAIDQWGVPTEARRALDAVAHALPEAKARMFVEVGYHERYAREKIWNFVLDWVNADLTNPYACRADEYYQRWSSKEDQDSRKLGKWALTYGECSQNVVRREYRWDTGNAHKMALGIEPIRREMTIDPWDVDLRGFFLEALSDQASGKTLRQEIARARADFPLSPQLCYLEGRLLEARACPVAARKCYDDGLNRFPRDYGVWWDRMNAAMNARDYSGAIAIVKSAQSALDDGLGKVSLLCTVAEQLLVAGQTGPARPLIERAQAIEEWKSDTLQGLGRLMIQEGKFPQGEEWFAKYRERYGADGDEIIDHIAAYLMVGRKADAIRTADVIYRDDQAKSATVLMCIAWVFLEFDDVPRAMSYLRKAKAKAADELDYRAKTMLAHPSLAVSLRFSHDARRLAQWLPVIEKDADSGAALDWLDYSRTAEAFEVLLSGVRMPRIGRRCAASLAQKAGLDLDLDPDATPQDMNRAYAQLAQWWSTHKAGYEERQFPQAREASTKPSPRN